MILVFRSSSLPASFWNGIVYFNVRSASWLEATAEPAPGPLATSGFYSPWDSLFKQFSFQIIPERVQKLELFEL
jgi:hypothetical protein